jgi:hypothetical protein
MKKSQLKYYILLGTAFLILAAWEIFKPKPTDWTMTLSRKDKIPYGTYVLYHCLPDIFPGKKITENQISFYQYETENQTENRNFIIINQDFKPDSIDRNVILKFAAAGSSVFISAFEFDKKFSDTLGFRVSIKSFYRNDTAVFRIANKSLNIPEKFILTKAISDYYFEQIDTSKTTVLSVFDENYINLIKIPFGKGFFIIGTEPAVFTNYMMLKNENAKYAFAALSYLPENNVVLDQYYKAEREMNKSALDYIFSNPALKSAYFLLLLSLLAYMFFTAKRKQRIIPVYIALKNTSLEFIQTLGHLYLHTQNHKDIALKKFNYFTDFLRTQYYISQQSIEKKETEIIASKTEVDIVLINLILSEIEKIQNSETLSKDSLLHFNKLIEDFYQQKQ